MDVIGQWLDQKVVREAGASVRKSAAYEDYRAWSEQEIGWALSAVRFGRNLEDRGFRLTQGAGGYTFIQGMKLKTEPVPSFTPIHGAEPRRPRVVPPREEAGQGDPSQRQ